MIYIGVGQLVLGLLAIFGGTFLYSEMELWLSGPALIITGFVLLWQSIDRKDPPLGV